MCNLLAWKYVACVINARCLEWKILVNRWKDSSYEIKLMPDVVYAQMFSSEIVSHYGITALPGEEEDEYIEEVEKKKKKRNY